MMTCTRMCLILLVLTGLLDFCMSSQRQGRILGNRSFLTQSLSYEEGAGASGLQGRHTDGGRFPLPSNDGYVTDVAEWAAAKIGGTLVAVVEAEGQVVAGEIFYLTIKVRVESKVEICQAAVWTKEWEHKRTLLNHKCSTQAKPAGRLQRGSNRQW